MQVYGPSFVHGAQSVGAPHAARSTGSVQPAASGQITDQLDISSAAQFVDQVSQLPDIRQDRVAALKAQIAAGTYETSDKLNGALDNLLNEIA
jgi:negative regulator of flagellin synthesis FlgM